MCGGRMSGVWAAADRLHLRDPVRLAAVLLLGLPVVAILASRGLVPLLVGVGLAALAIPAARREAGRLLGRPPALLLIAYAAWFTVTIAWAPELGAALQAAVPAALTYAFGFAALAAIGAVPPAQRPRLETCLAWAGLVFAGLHVAGMTACFWLPAGTLPAFAEAGRTCDEFALWRATPVLAILAVPFGVAVWRHFGRAVFAIVAVVVVITIASHFRDTAVLALAVGAAAFVVVRLGGRPALAICAALASLWILVAPLGVAAVINNPAVDRLLQQAPVGWQQRVYIWRTTIAQIAERPLGGHGIGFSKVYSRVVGPDFIATTPHGPVSLPSAYRDPHSTVLHIWLEAGDVGALLFAGALFALLLAVSRRPVPRSHLGAAGAAVAAWLVIADTDLAPWDPWWIATAWLCAAVVAALQASAPAAAAPAIRRVPPSA
jgi:O-antigen ligase